jgi:PBP1b-binding outer membrane lipoprotein LpoB
LRPIIKTKKKQMKKLFAILAVASVMTACNNGGDQKAATTDSPKTETPVTDAAKTADSAKSMMNSVADSAKSMMNKAADSAKGMINKAADSAKKDVKKAVDKVKEAVKH